MARRGIDPADVPNLTALYVGGVGVTGTPISQWDDQSGAGRHMEQTTLALRPTNASGAPKSEGGSDYMTSTGFGTMQPATQYASYIVFTLHAVPAYTTHGISAPALVAEHLAAYQGTCVHNDGGTAKLYAHHFRHTAGASDKTVGIQLALDTQYLVRVRWDGVDISPPGTAGAAGLWCRAAGVETSISTVARHTGADGLFPALFRGESGECVQATIHYAAFFGSDIDAAYRDGIDTWFVANFPGITL
jgi:hypothetical protein